MVVVHGEVSMLLTLPLNQLLGGPMEESCVVVGDRRPLLPVHRKKEEKGVQAL